MGNIFIPINYNCVLLADISGSPVSMDVGMCRSHCGSAYRTSNDRTQQDYLKYSSMLEFLRSKKVSGPCNFETATRAHCYLIIVREGIKTKYITLSTF